MQAAAETGPDKKLMRDRCIESLQFSSLERETMKNAHRYLSWALVMAQNLGHDDDCPRVEELKKKHASFIAAANKEAQRMLASGEEASLPGEKLKYNA